MRLMRVPPSGASSSTMSRHFGRTMPSTGTSAVEKYCRPSPSAARIRASASMIGLWAPLFEQKSSAPKSFGIMRR
jgi:hypothetical protein